jgi:3-isopropylmalate/(R)-2-methylmalate dehydratase large subunit
MVKTSDIGTRRSKTLYEKIWASHVVAQVPGHPAVLYVDLHLVHDGTYRRAFELLAERGLDVARTDLTFAVTDHCVPSGMMDAPANGNAMPAVVHGLIRVCNEVGIKVFGPDDLEQGIVHIIGPELGLTQPGKTIICGDSHTSTHGALGALAFAVGTTEIAHGLATQCVLQQRSKTMRVRIDGTIKPGVSAKDIILALLAREGITAGTGYAIEYSGETISGMGVDGRMTLCNMTAELGSRIGLVGPDEKTLAYLKGRSFAPKGADWDAACIRWRALETEDGAEFDKEFHVDANAVVPMVTYGTTPAMGIPVTSRIPDPDSFVDTAARRACVEALRYMDLRPGDPIAGTKVSTVFIGSCTNARIEDLRAAASLLGGRKVADGTRLIVVPGSQSIKRQAESEGLHNLFHSAGAIWGMPGCSLCVGMNGDTAAPGEYVASTSNRNFQGRQGPGVRTFLLSPLTAAATAIEGRIADPRHLCARQQC